MPELRDAGWGASVCRHFRRQPELPFPAWELRKGVNLAALLEPDYRRAPVHSSAMIGHGKRLDFGESHTGPNYLERCFGNDEHCRRKQEEVINPRLSSNLKPVPSRKRSWPGLRRDDLMELLRERHFDGRELESGQAVQLPRQRIRHEVAREEFQHLISQPAVKLMVEVAHLRGVSGPIGLVIRPPAARNFRLD
jgi:hypothetical protein